MTGQLVQPERQTPKHKETIPEMMTVSERELRRYKNNLVTSGFAVIAFGLWGFLRIVMKTLMTSERFQQIKESVGVRMSDTELTLFIVAMAFLVFSLNILFRAFVGASARLEGMGRRKGKIYPYFAVLLAINILMETIVDIAAVLDEGKDTGVDAATIIIDIASSYAIINLLHSLHRVRKIERSLSDSRRESN